MRHHGGLHEVVKRQAFFLEQRLQHGLQAAQAFVHGLAHGVHHHLGAALDLDVEHVAGQLGTHHSWRTLDEGIVRTLWMTADEIRACPERHRSPLLLRCLEDYLAGQRFPLTLVHTDISVTEPSVQ